MTDIFSASLPQPAFDAKQVQQNEALVAKNQGIAMYDLMEQAGAAVFTVIEQGFSAKNQISILVICGKGNNGGDGYVIARMAKLAGFTVNVLVLAQKSAISDDALTALQLAEAEEVAIGFHPDIDSATKIIEQSQSDLIVDSIFGIGFSGSLTKPMQKLITVINQHSAQKTSVDVPSGLSANTGWLDSVAVVADITVSFIALKKGLLTGQAANYVGKLVLANLNLGQAFAEQVPASANLQTTANIPVLLPRTAAAHKGSVGLVLAIGSNYGMPGAIRMSAEAALRCGASLAAVSCHQSNHAMVMAGRPELMLAPASAEQLALFPKLEKAKVLIIGPGLGQDDWAQQLFNLACNCTNNSTANLAMPKVIDADALILLSKNNHKNDNWVLTPHPGEAAALLGCNIETIEQDRFAAVKNIAQKYGGICVLKGAGSLISDGKTVWINSTGNSGMATGGMGDVLSGIIAALIMQMPNMLAAVRLAVFIHGLAADNIAQKNGQRGILASDLFVELQHLVNRPNT